MNKPYTRPNQLTPLKKEALAQLLKIEDEANKMIIKFGRHKATEYAKAKEQAWREQINKSLPCAAVYNNDQMSYWRSVCDYLQTYNPKSA